MTINEKLSAIQAEANVPKGQYNSFGKYRYRSCEDILAAIKPIVTKYKSVLIIGDALEHIGDRYYVKATAVLADTESESTISNTAYAREEETKKGMDGSQITGTASSYARKYALNGLFGLDDVKDADTNETRQQAGEKAPDVYCAECGCIITDTTKRDGTTWSATEVAAYSLKRFGRVLCPSCQREEFKRSKEHDAAVG